MGFLALSKERMRLSRLRRQLEDEPRPHGIAELARAYLALGDSPVALEVLEFGRERFPDSDELKRVHSLAVDEEARGRLARAKQRARTSPSVQTWLEVADAYRALDRLDLCTETLREALERFGEHGTVLFLLGEIRCQRFQDSLASTDGQAAESLLRRAIAAEPEALKPRFLLADLYHRVGATGLARTQVVQLMRMAPEHERGHELLARLDAAESPPTAVEDFDSLLLAVEERMALAGADTTAAGASGEPIAAPEDELRQVMAASGATHVLMVDADGGEHGDAPPAQGEVPAALRALAATMNRAARGMELGVPVRLTVEADDGAVVMEQKRGTAIFLVLTPAAGAERAAVAARDALERLVRG